MNPSPDSTDCAPNGAAAGFHSVLPASAAASRQDIIEKSWQRSSAYGLKADDAPDFSRLGATDLALLKERNRNLSSYALPVMDNLYEQIANTHSLVILTDIGGTVLHALGDDDFLEKAHKVAIHPGAVWSERSKGTNAIGTAIAEGMPTLVHGSEHYLNANHFLTCSAAPIFGADGRIEGLLDVSGDQRSYQPHTMALVRMSAQMIENQLFSAAFTDAITLHFHSRPELIGTLMEGIASFAPDGRFLSANRAGLFQLGLPLEALHSHTFSSLFNLPVNALIDHYRTAAPGYLALCLHTGVRVFARADLRLGAKVFQTGAGRQAPPAISVAPVRALSAPIHHAPSLQGLDTGDAKVSATIAKVKKVIGRDIAILITGETGTGKDLLAQAVHHAGPQAHGAFVAVNCASIPETLIESELFGYVEGAFTGARKSGSNGKMVQANGGTLFLDEIGDMPLSMQARLLRVLQDRTVTPLGSARAVPVSFTLVCATNRNLQELVAAGRFRNDLYYRINGLAVKLPPLRERSDLPELVRKLLTAQDNGLRYTVAHEVMELFRRDAWPGNVRQLATLLRTAMVMTDDDREIRVEHLPDDFLEGASGTMRTETVHRSVPESVSDTGRLGSLQIAAIRRAVAAHRGNISAAAKALGISRNTIYRKLNTD